MTNQILGLVFESGDFSRTQIFLFSHLLYHSLISFSRCDTDMYAKNDNGEVKEYKVNVYQVQEKRD